MIVKIKEKNTKLNEAQKAHKKKIQHTKCSQHTNACNQHTNDLEKILEPLVRWRAS